MKENIYIISVKNCADRRSNLKKHIKNTTTILNPIFFTAAEGKPGWIYCGISHIMLVEFAKSLNLPYIIVLEDDTALNLNFEKTFKSSKKRFIT